MSSRHAKVAAVAAHLVLALVLMLALVQIMLTALRSMSPL